MTGRPDAAPTTGRPAARKVRRGSHRAPARRPFPVLAGVVRPVRTPLVPQMEPVECGAAALAIVLAHHRRYVPIEELRVACGVSRDGAKASSIVRAARRFGLEARGMQMEPEHLAGQTTAPAILFWEFNHFVVWEGIGHRFGRQVVYLNDPATGRRVVTRREFGDGFTGVVLEMSPGPEFRRGGRRRGALAALLSRLRGAAGPLVIGLAAAAVAVLFGAVLPGFTRVFVDSVLLGGDTPPLVPFLGLMGAVVLATAAAAGTRQGYFARARLVGSTLSGARFVRHLLRLPVGFHAQRSPAELTRRLASVDAVMSLLTTDIAPSIVDCLVVVGYAALLAWYDPTLAAVGVGMALLNALVLRAVVRARASGVLRLRGDLASLYTASYNGLQLIETVKATGGEREFFQRWAGYQANVVNGGQRLGTPVAVLAALATLLAAWNSALVLLVGGLRAVDGRLSVGLLVAFQALVVRFAGPVASLTTTAGSVQDLAADVTRLRDVEDFPADPALGDDRPAGDGPLPTGVAVDDVTFGYHPLEGPLITGLSLAIGPGQIVAVVGASGSGKSTVSRLLSGLYEPWQGEVRYDGVPRREVPRAVLANSVAFVDQDIFLFEGTVRDNVTLWDPTIDDDAVVAALTHAAVYDEIARRPGGIHGAVAEDGRDLSGGQRQRLEIARALVRAPNILVLDEATSALDAGTEAVITANLRRLGCACLVIAHRVSTIRHSDEIIVLDRGRVVERGRHDDLMARGGAYTRLVGSG